MSHKLENVLYCYFVKIQIIHLHLMIFYNIYELKAQACPVDFAKIGNYLKFKIVLSTLNMGNETNSVTHK